MLTITGRHMEVWLDESSDPDEPRYCVSWCEEDGEEIKCLAHFPATQRGQAAAQEKAMSVAKKRDCQLAFRERNGQLSRI